MPMQQARCPECGAPVGGQRHVAASGVSRAQDWDAAADEARERFRRVNL